MSAPDPAVYVVDDDAAVLRAIGRLLRSAGFAVVTAGSATEFLAALRPDAAGCIVSDIAMPGLDGLALQRELARLDIQLPLIFLTGHGDIPTSVTAMKGGAVDFLTKPVSDNDLIDAVRIALAKDRQASRSRNEHRAIHQRLSILTPREREVLEQVVKGKLNKEVAVELGTVEKTIKVHRARVMQKMQVESVADLVRLAERAGIGKVG